MPTNPTTITSVPQDKSPSNSLHDSVNHPDGRSRYASVSGHEHDRNGRYPGIARPRNVLTMDGNTHPSTRLQSGLEWIPEKRRENTVYDRLEPTLVIARVEQKKFESKAKQYGMALNVAIGLQVAVGALTTGVAAATTGRSTSIGVSILGGLSTMLASFLAKARGSGEPDFSNLRARELDTFIREADAWILDHRYNVGSEYDETINMFRARYERIIKTEGEDSASGTSFGTQQAGPAKPNAAPAQGRNWQGNLKASEKV